MNLREWWDRRRLTPNDKPSRFLIEAFAPRSPDGSFKPGSQPISVTSVIEPDGDRWKWENEWAIWGHPSMSGYSMGGSKRHPGPDTVVGWRRDRVKAEAQRRRSLALMNAIAVEVLARNDYRSAMRYEEIMPI